ncbi:unnamed protein product [Protopolystoma xenopodis]|uniref:Trematode PH-like domain-containing protein n=1 Tax=Protopolystoma xenopodis TaxID=117903 RepID=A0A448X9A7_9PLAT|nr:unnamed protein product [Protopolystoma xenopodis]
MVITTPNSNFGSGSSLGSGADARSLRSESRRSPVGMAASELNSSSPKRRRTEFEVIFYSPRRTALRGRFSYSESLRLLAGLRESDILCEGSVQVRQDGIHLQPLLHREQTILPRRYTFAEVRMFFLPPSHARHVVLCVETGPMKEKSYCLLQMKELEEADAFACRLIDNYVTEGRTEHDTRALVMADGA